MRDDGAIRLRKSLILADGCESPGLLSPSLLFRVTHNRHDC